MRRQVLEKTGRHMSSQRQEQAFQVCTLSISHTIQAELRMLKKEDCEQPGMCCRASARLSTRCKATSVLCETGEGNCLRWESRINRKIIVEKPKHTGLQFLRAVMRDLLAPRHVCTIAGDARVSTDQHEGEGSCPREALSKNLGRAGHSQNHRMFRVGRDLCGSSSPTPVPK